MWNDIKNYYVLSHRQNGYPLEPQFFNTEKDAQIYYIVDICGKNLESDVDGQFKALVKHAAECGLNVYIEMVKDRVKYYEKLNEYNEDEFRDREEFLKAEFYWL